MLKFSRDNSTKVVFKGKQFYGIEKIGISESKDNGFVVSLYTTDLGDDDRRGGFFTSLPLSSLAYRKTTNSRREGYQRQGNIVNFFDDYGQSHKIEIDDSNIVDQLCAELEDNEVFERK